MNVKGKTSFRINIDKLAKGMWSFGICLSKWDEELYIYINIFKWSIAIGRLYDLIRFDDELDELDMKR